MGKLLAVLVWLASAASICAQPYPAKAVKIIVPYPPGGGTDVLARVLAKALSSQLGQSVFVENRGGGDATIGADAAAKSRPDGYTLLFVSGVPFVINQAVYSKLPYDTQKDFSGVSLFAQWPLILIANGSVPAKNLEEFITNLKRKPGELNYAGSDQMTFMAMEMIKKGTATDMVHIAYKGVGPALVDLLGGHVSVMLSSIGPAIEHVKSGKVHALAVTTPQRSFLFPEVPTVGEKLLPGYEVTAWYGLFAPAGTDGSIVGRLNAEVAAAVQSPEVKDHFASLGAEAVSMSPTTFSRFVRDEIQRWREAVRTSGVPVQ